MFSSSTWLHLRIPFSYLLLPVFLFALSISPNITTGKLLWSFILIHFFLYPASNGYNSYFDKDEKSIGLLKNPPPVKRSLYAISLLFDVIAVVVGLITVNFTFAAMLLIYGLVSKAYSHPSIRLKKYAITSWFITGLFQGMFTFIMCYVGINDYALENCFKPLVICGGLLTALMLWANYPITQVYQYEEDSKRGDRTFSMMLGIRGTFYFVGIVFAFVAVAFFIYFAYFFRTRYAVALLIALAPVVIFYTYWFNKILKSESFANYSNAMWLSLISATCLNVFFMYFFLNSTNIATSFQ